MSSSSSDDMDFDDSPYFTGASLTSAQEPNPEQFYSESTITKLKKMFPDKLSHMKVLLTSYKFCFPSKKVNKPIVEKTEQEVLEELTNTKISLDIGDMIQEQSDAIKNYYIEEKLFSKRVAEIPVFIDFAYLYYVWCYDSEAPIHKLPNSIFKFNMLSSALGVSQDKLNNAFAQCIENPFIRDLRIEKPPFTMRTDLSKDEIRKKINEIVKPVCKEILNGLFAMEMRREAGSPASPASQSNEAPNTPNTLEPTNPARQSNEAPNTPNEAPNTSNTPLETAPQTQETMRWNPNVGHLLVKDVKIE